MSQRLFNRSKNVEIAEYVRVASTAFARTKGLLGECGINDGEALWIERCRSIHTWFMRFPIDVVFVDDRLVVKKVYENLGPWRMTLPAWGADSVFEMAAGTLGRKSVEIGDQLHVGD